VNYVYVPCIFNEVMIHQRSEGKATETKKKIMKLLKQY